MKTLFLLLLAAFSASSAAFGACGGTTYNIGSGQTYATYALAFAALQADCPTTGTVFTASNTLHFTAGTYNVQVNAASGYAFGTTITARLILAFDSGAIVDGQNTRQYAVQGNQDHLTISGGEFKGGTLGGIGVTGNDFIGFNMNSHDSAGHCFMQSSSDGLLVHDSVFHDCANTGFFVASPTLTGTCEIYNITSHDNGDYGAAVWQPSCVIHDSLLYHNVNRAGLDITGANVVAYNNISHHNLSGTEVNAGGGILGGVILRNNFFLLNTEHNIDIGNGASAEIYNNTLFNATQTSGGNEILVVTPCPAGCAAPTIIKNNLIIGGSNETQYGLMLLDHSAGIVLDNNDLFFVDTGGGIPTNFATWGVTPATSFAGWKTLSGQDANSISANPGFTNAGGTSAVDYQWSSGSPAQNAGATISGFTIDYFGTTRTAPWDIGAFEYAGAPPPPPPPAGTLTVCASGCDYTTVQAAGNAAVPGNTIVIEAGYNNAGPLVLPDGTHGLTFKSSRIDAYPRNTRIVRNSPALAKIEQVTLGNGMAFALLPSAMSTLTTNAPHGFTIGEKVTVAAQRFSAYYCGSLCAPPYNMPYNNPFSTAGTVNVSGTAVTWLSGPTFTSQWIGGYMTIAGAPCNPCQITAVNSSTSVTLSASGGLLSGASFTMGFDIAVCEASRVGFINIRFDTHLANGMIVYFAGRTLPPPLQLNTPYYVINFATGSSWPINADKFQVSATLGGSPIILGPNWANTPISGIPYDPTGQDFTVVIPPLPAMDGSDMYVVSAPTTTSVQLSLTLGGSPVTFAQAVNGYNGGGFSNGFRIFGANPVYDMVFDGIELFPPDDNQVYYVFFAQGGVNSNFGEHFGINLLRCWAHGHDDQEDFPMSIINITGRNLEVGWSVVENSYSVYNDTQNIGITSTSNVYIHDNELKGATENIFSGGNYPWFAGVRNTEGLRVERNWLWKPLKYFHGLWPTLVDSTHFTIEQLESGTDCSTIDASNLTAQCYWWESNESAPDYSPANPTISRHVWTQNPTNSTFTVTVGAPTGGCPNYLTAQGLGQLGCGFIYGLGGVIHMDYSFLGTVTCPGSVVCTFVATPSFPTTSSRLGIAMMDTGGFQGDFYFEMRHVYQKNHIESKYGDYWNIVGNVFDRQTNCDNGTFCQSEGIHWTVSGNGSYQGDPINSATSSSYSTARHNIFRGLAAGIGGTGETYAVQIGGNIASWEWAGFGKSVQNTIENNLFIDIGSSEYTRFGRDGYMVLQSNAGYPSTQQPTLGSWIVKHNTGVDLRHFVVPSFAFGTTYDSNIAVPYRFGAENPLSGTTGACPGGGCPFAHVAATTHLGVIGDIGNGWLPDFGGGYVQSFNSGLIDSTAVLNNNILMNRAGYFYGSTVPTNYPACPTGTMGKCTYLVQYTDTMPGGLTPDPSLLFQTFNERNNALPPTGSNYRASNLRLAAGMAATYPAADARDIGADIDEIEAITGAKGVDVEKGVAQFSVRSARQISPGSTTAAISYLSDGQVCSIKLWPNTSYSGSPTVSITDSGAAVIGGRVSVGVTGLSASTNYQGKRICGTQGSASAHYDILSFTTTPATPVQVLQFTPPAGVASCEIEHGSTSSLGSTTSPVSVSAGTCSIALPASAFYRVAYLDSGSTVIRRGQIQQRGL